MIQVSKVSPPPMNSKTYSLFLQIRMARTWFPCVDTPLSAHSFKLLLDVGPGMTAVGPGELHRVSETLDRRKTYEYHLRLDTPPCHISFAIGEMAP